MLRRLVGKLCSLAMPLLCCQITHIKHLSKTGLIASGSELLIPSRPNPTFHPLPTPLLSHFNASARLKALWGHRPEEHTAGSDTETAQPWVQETEGRTGQIPTAGNRRAALDLSGARALLTVQYHFFLCI